MKTRKTYYVEDMIEWLCQIQVGGTSIKIPFSNGNASAYGAQPAEFTTENEMYQHVIEHSEYFKNEVIKLERVVKIPEPSDMAAVNSNGIGITTNTNTASISEKKTVNVSSVQEAKDYLIDDCHLDMKGIRKKEDIISIGREHGIIFNWLD